MAKSVIEMRGASKNYRENLENSENLLYLQGIADSAIENASAIDEVSHTRKC